MLGNHDPTGNRQAKYKERRRGMPAAQFFPIHNLFLDGRRRPAIMAAIATIAQCYRMFIRRPGAVICTNRKRR